MPQAKFSDLGNNIRLDAEFFSEENQVFMNQLKEHELVKLGTCACYIKDLGKFSLYKTEYLVEKGIPFLRATDIKKNFIDFSNTIFIEEDYHKKLVNSQVKENDILLTTKGVIGISACFSAEIGECNMSQNLVRISIDRKQFNPFFVSVFLNTKFGRFQTKRLSSGNMQPYLNFENIRKVLIPNFPMDFQNEIESLIKKHEKLKKESEILFKEAETILMNEIGLENGQMELKKEHKTQIRSFSESFEMTNRLDADFYQEKYNFIEYKIQNYSNGFDTIENLCEIKDSNFLLSKEKKYKYIELANIDKNGNISELKEYLGEKLPNRAKRIVKTGDLIISSINGSLDKCTIIDEKWNNLLCSTAFYVINSEQINPETLFVFFKNQTLQNLTKKACSGTILISANRKDFGQIIFPKIRKDIQNQISTKVNKSLNLQQKAKEILLHVNEKIENLIKKSV